MMITLTGSRDTRVANSTFCLSGVECFQVRLPVYQAVNLHLVNRINTIIRIEVHLCSVPSCRPIVHTLVAINTFPLYPMLLISLPTSSSVLPYIGDGTVKHTYPVVFQSIGSGRWWRLPRDRQLQRMIAPAPAFDSYTRAVYPGNLAHITRHTMDMGTLIR